MKVIRGIKAFGGRIKGSVVTIGVFDGVHIGHQYVIKKVIAAAKELKLKSLVVTFDPHPLKVLRRGSGALSLISLEHRIKLICSLGIDNLVVLRFTKVFSRLSTKEFIKNIRKEIDGKIIN